ncbi:MAG TPA: class I SAM-dependent methyltransferase [Burkholderiales bacterium]|nr:class I SAM-dependent methyltransferase [Burkholderiales bacterium]
MIAGPCTFCGASLEHTFCDLGMSPLSNSFLSEQQLQQMEPFYPLHAYVCEKCFLVQLQEFESPQHIFAQDYAYFSSYSQTWLDHARNYADYMVRRFGFGPNSQVIEIASNDGYLLQYFKQKNVPVLGIEPAENCAQAAEQIGIPTLVRFFGTALAKELQAQGKSANLLLGNNVLAHVPDLNDFVAGLKILLKPHGVITMEFPHLLRLMLENQFDTIYHEHFSYFSFYTVEKVFARHGLKLFDVEQLPTHGGSLRIFGTHAEDATMKRSDRVQRLREEEIAFGIAELKTYVGFSEQVKRTKRKLLEFLVNAKASGKTIVGYGAPAKGNTLLNYCGIRSDFLDYTVDRSPHKQGKFLPGTHVPVHAPEKIRETRPDYVLILPWNIKDEIMEQIAEIRSWGGRFVVPIPEVRVLD